MPTSRAKIAPMSTTMNELPVSLFLYSVLVLLLSSFTSLNATASPPLTLDYYASTCPTVFDIIRKEMECCVLSDPRNAALLVRLHFHDCFVQGCDASILLDDTYSLKGEKPASTNINSVMGYDIIDRIKSKIESDCPGIVSCADILTIAARDAVILVGGPYWDVPLGRKDSKTASAELAVSNLPTANEGIISLIYKFVYQGLSVTDMVALLGAHTIGMARCENFRARIYGEFETTAGISPMSESYASSLRSICPPTRGEENNVSALDNETPNLFDNNYFRILQKGEGLLNSDQELYSSILAIQTRQLVKKYAADQIAFFEQFSESMVKMGNLTDSDSLVNGEVRLNCRFVNT